MKIYRLDPNNDDRPEADVNWKMLYTIMISAADHALTQIEQGKFIEAKNTLLNAVLVCEDEYIGDV